MLLIIIKSFYLFLFIFVSGKDVIPEDVTNCIQQLDFISDIFYDALT